MLITISMMLMYNHIHNIVQDKKNEKVYSSTFDTILSGSKVTGHQQL